MLLVEFIGQTKVNEFGLRKGVAVREHDVFRLDVAVHNALVMNVPNGRAYLVMSLRTLKMML